MPRLSPPVAPRLPSTTAAIVAVIVAVAGIGCQKPSPAPPPPASEVMFTTPRTVRVPEYLEVTGRIDAELLVDIRSRITGYLTKVAFRDGQFVAKGDPLYEIDERPYTAQLAAAAGTVEQLMGQQKFLKVQVERYEKLAAPLATSQQEFDSYTAKLDENVGALAAARAQHEFARLNVEFCTIAAPIDGQISRTQLQVGNLINQDQTTLATIVSIDPIFVYFNVDEPTLVRMMAHARESGRGPGNRGSDTVVDVGLVDDVARKYPYRSRVDFLNNQVDAKTATITMRGRLDNPYSRDPVAPRPPLFRPGMFARVRLPLGDAVDFRDPSLADLIGRLRGHATGGERQDQDGERRHGERQWAARQADDSPSLGILRRLLVILGAGFDGGDETASRLTPAEQCQLVEWIDGHLDRPLALEELAALFRLSVGHFARKVRNTFRMCPSRVVQQRRALAAIALMKDRDRSLAALAAQLGFSSQSHFTTMFRRHVGMTPAVFRHTVHGHPPAGGRRDISPVADFRAQATAPPGVQTTWSHPATAGTGRQA